MRAHGAGYVCVLSHCGINARMLVTGLTSGGTWRAVARPRVHTFLAMLRWQRYLGIDSRMAMVIHYDPLSAILQRRSLRETAAHCERLPVRNRR